MKTKARNFILLLFIAVIPVMLCCSISAFSITRDNVQYAEVGNMNKLRKKVNSDIDQGKKIIRYACEVDTDENLRRLSREFSEIDLPETSPISNRILIQDGRLKTYKGLHYLTNIDEKTWFFIDYRATNETEKIRRSNKKLLKIFDEIAPVGSDYDKVKLIHDWIVENITYDKTLNKKTSMDAILTKETICNGYAILFQRLCSMADLDCVYITGKAGADGELHAWNAVSVDGNWYYVDTCWDAANRDRYYFLRGAKDMEDHCPDKVPVAVAKSGYDIPFLERYSSTIQAETMMRAGQISIFAILIIIALMSFSKRKA